MDHRVHCLVSTVPFLSGGAIWNMLPAEVRQNMLRMFETDRKHRAAGQAPQTVAIAAEDPARTPCILPTRNSWEWCMRVAAVAPNWRNEVTVRSLESQFCFEPMAYIGRITPRSFLLIGAEHDDLIPVALTREAFERARCPDKDLVVFSLRALLVLRRLLLPDGQGFAGLVRQAPSARRLKAEEEASCFF